MNLGRLLEAGQVLEKVALKHSSKSTKYELEGSYGDPVHEHFSFLKTAKLPRECNEGDATRRCVCVCVNVCERKSRARDGKRRCPRVRLPPVVCSAAAPWRAREVGWRAWRAALKKVCERTNAI